MRSIFFLFLGSLLACSACQQPIATDYKALPAMTENGVNVVVEIPAGTNHKIEYQPRQGRFENDIENGKDRVIQFLPYPGNYGFIPSTLMDEARGGDGDALDILVLGESVPTGEVISVKPIAVLELLDDGEIDSKLIAIPADTSLQVLPAQNFQDFLIQYDAAKRIIESWFLNYKGFGAMQLVGWKDEQAAMAEIKKWAIQ
jgi:inorganic pyrophosphatase